MTPSSVGAFQRAAYDKFPTVTVVNVADALAIVQQVVDSDRTRDSLPLGFRHPGGCGDPWPQASPERASGRVREVVILKTLGGTRRQVSRIFSVEFLTLGAVAGLLERCSRPFFRIWCSSACWTRIISSIPGPPVIAIVLTRCWPISSGWLASFRILRQKPLEVLRGE